VIGSSGCNLEDGGNRRLSRASFAGKESDKLGRVGTEVISCSKATGLLGAPSGYSSLVGEEE